MREIGSGTSTRGADSGVDKRVDVLIDLVLMIAWLVDHPETFVVFWVVIIPLLGWVLLMLMRPGE